MSGNGEAPRQMQDIRAVPTGTLVFNLIRVSVAELGMGNAIMAFEQEKKQQKMLIDPPPLSAMKEQFKSIEHDRFVMALELNRRFADMDMMRCAKLGIEIIEVGGPTPASKTEQGSD